MPTSGLDFSVEGKVKQPAPTLCLILAAVVDPGRGGFHAVEKEEELERVRLDVEEAERHWSGSEAGTAPGSKAGSRGSTPWDHYRRTAACSF